MGGEGRGGEGRGEGGDGRGEEGRGKGGSGLYRERNCCKTAVKGGGGGLLP